MKIASWILAIAFLASAQSFPSSDGPGQSYRISVAVDLVVLQASVHDSEGHAVPNLGQQDFEVFEDGVPQHIRLFRHEDTPVTVGLVIDHSGSMYKKLADIIAGARAFVRSSNPKDQMFVVNFNEKVSLGLPTGMPFSDSVKQLGDAIGRAPASGMTALYAAIVEALKRLRESTEDKKVLIVISDGGDNASKIHLDDVLKMTEQSRAAIYTIGTFDKDDPDQNERVLRRLAKETGGEAFFPQQLSETVEIYEHIARDIRDQYTIGYSSTNARRDGAYRKVRLTTRVKGIGKLSVRTRTGYSTAAAPSPPPPPMEDPAVK